MKMWACQVDLDKKEKSNKQESHTTEKGGSPQPDTKVHSHIKQGMRTPNKFKFVGLPIT